MLQRRYAVTGLGFVSYWKNFYRVETSILILFSILGILSLLVKVGIHR